MSNRNQQKKRNNKKNQQQFKEKISKTDDIVFHDKNDLTNVNDENEPKKVENDILSACECDDVVDDVNENLISRNDCGYGTLLTLNTIINSFIHSFIHSL